MGSQRGGTDRRDTGRGPAGTDEGPAERDRSTQSRRVHVRQLDAVDTLRWSWEVLTDRFELVGLAFAVGLLSVLALFGVSPTVPSEPPRVADWALPVYVAFLAGIAAVWGVVYVTANAAVKERSVPLAHRLKRAVTRLPALFATGVLTWLISALGLVLLVLPGVYLYHRLVLSYPACVIDGKGPLASLKAGWRASRGNAAKIFGINLGYLGLVGASNFAAGVFGRYSLASGFVSAGVTAGVVPLFGLAFGHLYLERSRNQ